MVTALRNVSGVQTQVLYGVYEQYTVRGFNAKDVVLVDGMRTEAALNRFNGLKRRVAVPVVYPEDTGTPRYPHQ